MTRMFLRRYCVECRCEYSCNDTHRNFETLGNQVENQTGHNSNITTPSIAKFTSESDIGDQAMSHCPWSNIGDQSIFHRGSINFEILSSVIFVICLLLLKSRFERLRQVTKLEVA